MAAEWMVLYREARACAKPPTSNTRLLPGSTSTGPAESHCPRLGLRQQPPASPRARPSASDSQDRTSGAVC